MNSPNNTGNREIQDKNNTENMHDINTQKIWDKFPELSNGIGCLEDHELYTLSLMRNALGESIFIYKSYVWFVMCIRSIPKMQ
jgi:hypothetical protein